MITHKNICSVVSNLEARVIVDKKDSYCSYLPMPHVMERAAFNTMLYYSVQIGIYSGDMLKVTEDLQALKPTIFATVPRMFNKIYDKIIGQV